MRAESLVRLERQLIGGLGFSELRVEVSTTDPPTYNGVIARHTHVASNSVVLQAHVGGAWTA